MAKLLLVFVMMVTGMVAGCETVRLIQTGCYGYWEEKDGHKRGTRWSNKNSNRPWRQCVEKEAPHRNIESSQANF